MKRLRELLVCGLAALGLLSGVAGAAEVPAELDAMFQRYVSLPDAILPVLTAARDKASADKMAPELEALMGRVSDSRRELLTVPALTDEVAEAVRRKYEAEMRSRWGKVYDEIYRLQRVRCYESISFFKQFITFCVLLGK